MRKAVFIDRDGVINSDEGHYYIFKIEDFKLNPCIADNLRLLQQAGFLLIIITNQGGIARKIYSKNDVDYLHHYMLTLLQKEGVVLTDIFYCPHHHEIEKCLCRKPQPLLIQRAAGLYQIDISNSWFIGDNDRDMEAARLSGLKGVKVVPNTNIRNEVDRIIQGY